MTQYEIFQIHDTKCGYHFMGKAYAEEHGYEIKKSDYVFVYSGEADGKNDAEILESLYAMFNADKPEGYHGYSLSVSDVIVLIRGGKRTAYYINDIGFSALEKF